MGFQLGQTAFNTGFNISFGRKGCFFGTGESFVTTPPDIEIDIMDM